MKFIPMFVLLFCSVANIGVHFAKDGEPKTGKYDAPSELFAAVIFHIILWLGGWYSVLS